MGCMPTLLPCVNYACANGVSGARDLLPLGLFVYGQCVGRGGKRGGGAGAISNYYKK